MTQDDRLRLEYIPLDQASLWDTNPKIHDKPGIKASFRQHGFKDPPKYEPHLNDGQGGLSEGNGRSICLQEMRDDGEEPPRGILLDEQGQWTYPVLFGVDAESEAAAESYAIDHNNLTILGGAGFGVSDTAYMYDIEDYLGILDSLADLDQLPASVALEDLDAIKLSVGLLDDLSDLLVPEEAKDGETLYALRIRTGDRELFETVAEKVGAYVRRKGWKVEVEITA